MWTMRAPSPSRLTALVTGRVQGVGYRAFVRREAIDLGLAGYVENLPDGRVEIMAEGPLADLEHFLGRLRVGPVHAVVDAIDIQWGEAGGADGFHTF
jgi:acylphosphatase